MVGLQYESPQVSSPFEAVASNSMNKARDSGVYAKETYVWHSWGVAVRGKSRGG